MSAVWNSERFWAKYAVLILAAVATIYQLREWAEASRIVSATSRFGSNRPSPKSVFRPGETCPGRSEVSIEALSESELSDPKRSRIFLLETSGRAFLNPRQACAVESAAKNSGLDDVYAMVRSKRLDLTDNTTCNVYRETRAKFRRIVPKKHFEGTMSTCQTVIVKFLDTWGGANNNT